MMGVPAKYDNNVEQNNTHPMLLPKVETERLTIPEEELLKEIVVLAPTKQDVTSSKMPKKEVPQSVEIKLISLRSSVMAKQRSVSGERKYGPGPGPQCPLSKPI
jgi:hypothetical protein